MNDQEKTDMAENLMNAFEKGSGRTPRRIVVPVESTGFVRNAEGVIVQEEMKPSGPTPGQSPNQK